MVGLFLCLGLCGCAHMAPRGMYYQQTPPMAFKRAPVHPERDLVWRWRRKAYTQLKVDPAATSPDECTVLKKYGQPDYVRHFRAQKCEKVTEWVFLKPSAVVQFVKGDLAYSGPFTDYEKLLIDRGYPNAIVRVQAARGPERMDTIYWGWIHSKVAIYSFANGDLVGMQEP